MAYNRDAAVAYARLFAQVPCSDNFIMLDAKKSGGLEYLATPAGTTIVGDFSDTGELVGEHMLLADGTPLTLPDGTPLTNWHADDCTHFISCCIGQPPKVAAGGVKLPPIWGDPPDNPYGISNVGMMITRLTTHGLASAVATQTDDPGAIDQLAHGDLIAYHNVANDDDQHLALYVGGGRDAGAICTHTKSRLASPWQILTPPDYTWTFLHFI